ncbi:MAG: PspC domain-containing protein [Sphingomonadaceae bacterium]
MNQGFALDKSNARLMGVGSGLARSTGLDPLIVRLLLVLLTLLTGPVMILIYLATGWLAPERR